MMAQEQRASGLAIWTAAAALALAAHAGIAAHLLIPDDLDEPGGPRGAFVLELVAIPLARPDIPTEIAPGPDQVAAPAVAASRSSEAPVEEALPHEAPAEPESVPLAPTQPVNEPEVVLPQQKESRAEPTEKEQAPQAETPATTMTQVEAERVAPIAAAPVAAPPAKVVSDALPTWRGKIETLLQRTKRYPQHALAREQQGVVHVSFVIDRSGKLITAKVERGSGYATLDEEALALLRRADPFPAPPAHVSGEHISLAVPIRFSIR